VIPLPQTATLTDVVLRDGSTVCVRHADEPDIEAVLQFLQSLSPASLHDRFHGHTDLTSSSVRSLIGGDGSRATTTLIAESGGRIVALAGYYKNPEVPDRAEVAFAVSDAVQGHGIGTRLLEQLAAIAREEGLHTFDAYVLGENQRMLDVFRNSGLAETVSVERGVCHVTVSLAVTDDFVAHAAARSQLAASASMRSFFEPRVVAVVGASRTRGKIGSEILNNLVVAGFTGTIVPVHPAAAEIGGLPAYRRVTDIPGAVDLAMIVVPAEDVLAAVDDCISKSVPAMTGRAMPNRSTSWPMATAPMPKPIMVSV